MHETHPCRPSCSATLRIDDRAELDSSHGSRRLFGPCCRLHAQTFQTCPPIGIFPKSLQGPPRWPSLPPSFQHAASLGPVWQLSERLIPHIAMQLVGQAGVVVLENSTFRDHSVRSLSPGLKDGTWLHGRLLKPPEPAESPSGGIGLFPPWKPQLNNSVTTPPRQCATCRLPCGQTTYSPTQPRSQQQPSTRVRCCPGALAVAPLPM